MFRSCGIFILRSTDNLFVEWEDMFCLFKVQCLILSLGRGICRCGQPPCEVCLFLKLLHVSLSSQSRDLIEQQYGKSNEFKALAVNWRFIMQLYKCEDSHIKKLFRVKELQYKRDMMLFGLGRLFYVILLLINAVAVLNEERFLRRSM